MPTGFVLPFGLSAAEVRPRRPAFEFGSVAPATILQTLTNWEKELHAIFAPSPIPLGLVVAAAAVGYGLYRLWLSAKRKTAPQVRVPAVAAGGAVAAPSIGVSRPGPSRPPLSTQAFGLRLTLAFVLIVSPFLWFSGIFFSYYGRAVAIAGEALWWPGSWPGAAARAPPLPPDFIFIMYLSGILAFVATVATSRRDPYPGSTWGSIAGAILLYPILSVVLAALLYAVPFPPFAASASLLIRAFLGSIVLMLVIFAALVVPPPMTVTPSRPRDRATFVEFAFTGVAGIGGAIVLVFLLYQFAGFGQLVLPFAVLLLLPTYAITFWGLAGRLVYRLQLAQRPPPAVAQYHPPVSIIIPAYNEERNITEVIESADRAAAVYPGTTEILIGNDGSVDRTSERAREALTHLEHATGRLLDLAHGGKSNALNATLRAATGDILVRVDADSRISSTTGFAAMVPHFADPEVGGVQGALLPLQREGWTRKLRFMELAWNHLFLRRATYAVRAAQVVDGAFCAFRRKDLEDAGGWVSWNGEDTEITLRLQRLGYRMRFEPAAVAFEDVPANYKELKKQRVRWNRGGLFAHLRHYGSLFSDAPEFGGLAMVVWLTIFARGGMRQLVYFYALLATLLLRLPTLYDLGLIIALIFVPRALVIVYYTLRLRWKAGLRWVPIWPATSGLKQYFTTEAFGTMLPGLVTEFSE